MDTKKCSKCGIVKPLSQISKDNRRPDGYGYRCLDCCNEASKKYHSSPKGKLSKKKSDMAYYQNNIEQCKLNVKRRKTEGVALINSYKSSPCSDCGKTYLSDCMELDHVRGNKILHVSGMKAMSREKLIKEIEKCEVVCANCHRIRTAANRAASKEARLIAHRELINNYKSMPCTDCKISYPPVAMDLDHVRDEKVLEISNMGHYPRWKVLEELAKCEVVCANCHRIRTRERKQS